MFVIVVGSIISFLYKVKKCLIWNISSFWWLLLWIQTNNLLSVDFWSLLKCSQNALRSLVIVVYMASVYFHFVIIWSSDMSHASWLIGYSTLSTKRSSGSIGYKETTEPSMQCKIYDTEWYVELCKSIKNIINFCNA